MLVVLVSLVELDARGLELWASCNECFTCLVGGVLSEVLDETTSQVLSFLFPLSSVSISVAWVEDSRINTWQCSWNLEIEEWDLLGLSRYTLTWVMHISIGGWC